MINTTYILYGGIGLFSTYLLIVFIEKIVVKVRQKKYCALFSKSFEETKDIKMALTAVSEKYHSGTFGKTVSGAINYLENSIMRDYKTALMMISNYFRSKKVERMHDEFIQKAKEQRRLLLEEGGKS